MQLETMKVETDAFGFPVDPSTGDEFTPVAPRTEPKARGRRTAWLRRAVRRTIPLGVLAWFIMALVGAYFWDRFIVIIPSGHGGVLYRTLGRGTVTDYVYPEGLHLMFPWDRLYDYDTKVQLVLSNFTVLTNKGLPIELKLAIRYHPEYDMLGLLHQKVGPEYVQKIVQPQVESVLRRSIGTEEPEAIYTNKEGVLTAIITRAIEETNEKYVSIDDIIIREVVLPEQVSRAINDKLVFQQQDQAYEFRLAAEQKEADRKHIEANGIREYQEIVNKSLTDRLLSWENIRAINDLSRSGNSKVIVMGTGQTPPSLILPAP